LASRSLVVPVSHVPTDATPGAVLVKQFEFDAAAGYSV
jgi:hypothetical protein